VIDADDFMAMPATLALMVFVGVVVEHNSCITALIGWTLDLLGVP